MFKQAETGVTLSDAAFSRVKDTLRLELVQLQQRCRLAAEFPILIVLSGIPGAGVIDSLNLLNTWMDPRWIRTHAFDTPSDEERERPPFWRFWRGLPAAGTIGLYLDGWYGDILAGTGGPKRVQRRLEHIRGFEKALTDDGALIVKFWLHLGKEAASHKADRHRSDATFGFRASDSAHVRYGSYAKVISAAGRMVRTTNTDDAPWHVVDGSDDNHRRATLLRILCDAMKTHRKAFRAKTKTAAQALKSQMPVKVKDALARIDLEKSIGEAAYTKVFHTHQATLYELQKAARAAGISTVLAFEGWDAAGKGGAIRRLTYALSARNYQVVPIAAPSDEERAHHYLWRFWRHLSRAGHVTLFDRSWYGRVLVERVDKLVPAHAWSRAYGEINAFEEQLTEHGIVLLKFWLHIDAAEQLARFKERRDTPYKRWKITEDDWHNRAKRAAYIAAINEMIARTSTKAAPWTLIPAANKRYARIAVMEAVIEALKKALQRVN